MSEQSAKKPARKHANKPVNMRKTRANVKKLPPNPRLRNKAHRPPLRLNRVSAGAVPEMPQKPWSNLPKDIWKKIKSVCFSTKEKQRNSIALAVMAFGVIFSMVWGLSQQKTGEAVPAYSPAGPAPVAHYVSSVFDKQDNSFVLKGIEQFSEEEIERYLSFTPHINFKAAKLEDGNVRITPEKARNIAYKGTFKFPREDGSEKTINFDVNAPGLTVKLEESRIYEHWSASLTFSEQVDIYSLQQNISITPDLEYELYHDLNEVRIEPVEGWIYSDRYTITIGENYRSANGKQFSGAKSLVLEINDSSYRKRVNSYIEFKTSGDFMLNPSDKMTMSFYANNLAQNVPVIIDTYRMPSVEKYRNQGHIYLDYDIKLDSLEKLDTNVFLIENSPKPEGKSYYDEFTDDGRNKFVVPNPGEGAYILTATYTDPVTKAEKTVRTGYLVTPVSAYMQTGERETAIWLNSSNQSVPLSGYEVIFEGMDEPAGKTDERGLLIVPNEKVPNNGEDDWRSHIPFSVTSPDGTLVYYDSAKNMYLSREHRDYYYSYLFLDRTLYKPEDTVCFWGFVKPFRNNTTEMPKTAFVRFDPDGLDITIEAEIDESGIFSGEIELERIKSTQYAVTTELRFPIEQGSGDTSDEEYDEIDEMFEWRVLDTEYISVKEFQKPTFVLSSTTDKDYYGGDDRVTVTVKAAFYDGTPLPNYPLEIAYYDTSTNGWTNMPDIKTDPTGSATFSFPAVNGGEWIEGDYMLRSDNYKVQIASDGEQVTHVGGYRYFPSNILIETAFEEKDGNVSMTARTYKFDINSPALKEYMESLKTETRYWRWFNSNELLKVAKGEPVDVELNLDLRWNYTDQNKISHRNRDGYASDEYIRYKNSYSLDYQTFEIIDDWETKIKRIAVETKDGVAVIDDLIYKREGNVIDFSNPVYISAQLSYKDDKRTTYKNYSYYTNTSDYDYWNRSYDDEEERVVPGYSFAITDITTGEDITPKSIYYDGISVSAEHVLKFDLLLDGKPVERNGRIFYSIIQDGIYEYDVAGQTSFSMPYKIAYGRNVRLVAVYFDGEKTRYIKQLDLQATNESLGVNIEVTPDKTGYRPGETVNLAVRATDYMGRGVSGNLCVAVVDEAIFALAEQEVDALYGIYRMYYNLNNSVSQYCTTYRNENEPGNPVDGGKGDEGGVEFYDSYRSKFKDTALFLPTKTDSGGNSHISFTLPDNTTSWRITAVEVGSDLRAGQNKSNIISSLPFFVKPVMTSKYIEGDDVSMLVQGHGTLLSEGDDISYTVTLQGDGTDITLNGEGKTGTPLEFSFGKLPIGSYTVISKAQYSGYSDTVELPLYVLKSNLELVISRPIDPQKKLDISAVRYPVTLTFYDKENEAFFASINSLFGHYCMQANQRLSRFVAKRVVRNTVVGGTVPSYIAEGNDNASDMQNEDGGIAFYPGQASDPLVTMYVQLVAQDQFNLPLMARYYRNELNGETDPKIRAACWLGLAAIGDATEDEIFAEIIEKTDLPVDAYAYLVAALAYLGETDNVVRSYFGEPVNTASANLSDTDNAAVHKAAMLYKNKLAPLVAGINPDVRQNEEYERNAAAIWVAASRLHHPDADALSMYFGGTHWRYRTLFECMIYVTNYDRQVTTTAFSYTTKGETKNIDLGFSGISTVVLSKSELESFSINNPPESLRATAYYVGEPSEFGLAQSHNMGISKSIRAVDGDTYEVTLKISLTKDAPTGWYDISDWVPSNTRLYSYDSTFKSGNDTLYFNTSSEGQKLYMSFNNNKKTAQEIIYRYQVRQTFTSTAALDTAYMIHGDSGDNCHTEKSEFSPSAMPGRQTAITAVN